MSTSPKPNPEPARMGVVLVIAGGLGLVVFALPELVYPREPDGGIGGLMLMGAIGMAPTSATHRMRKSGRSRRQACFVPVGSLLALVVFCFMLEVSGIIPSSGLFPVSLSFGIFCIPLALIACGLTAAMTEPAEKRGTDAPPEGDIPGTQMK